MSVFQKAFPHNQSKSYLTATTISVKSLFQRTNQTFSFIELAIKLTLAAFPLTKNCTILKYRNKFAQQKHGTFEKLVFPQKGFALFGCTEADAFCKSAMETLFSHFTSDIDQQTDVTSGGNNEEEDTKW